MKWPTDSELFGGIGDWFKKTAKKTGDLFGGAAEDVGDWFGDRASDVGGFFKNAASGVSNFFNRSNTGINGSFGKDNSFMGDKSLIGGQLNEWFGSQNPYSAEGQQRTENQRARDFSMEEAAKQRDWEKMMADTSFQRGMQDMKASGINPMLAYQQGGAAVPSGAAASASGASQTAKSNPIGSLAHIAALFTGLVTTGAKLGAMSNNSMAKIMSNEKIASLKNASAWSIADAKNKSMLERSKIGSDDKTWIMGPNGELEKEIWTRKHKK